MLYTTRGANVRDPDEALYQSLQPVISGMGMSLLELSVFRGKTSGNVQVRVVVYRDGITGVDDCSKVHRGILPRLELAFPDRDIYLEVSSPGIDRLIKDGSEFAHYIGKGVKCYRTDISDWTVGLLLSSDSNGITLKAKDGELVLPYQIIAKARLSGEM
ncbi:MAG: ribosome assembly cofactor RimP [Treponema sp.]|nr:ribosome assembly cofactor RimP [Treponema sp.]